MPEQPIQLLLIEDNRDAAYLVRKLLEEIKPGAFRITHAERLAAGVEHLSAQPVDAILLDLNLPDSTGLETLARVHAHQPNAPIIVMTSLDDETVALEAMRQGAQDYLIKGRSDGELIARAIRYAIERTRAEQTLQKSQAELRAVYEYAPVKMCLLDPDRKVLYANRAFTDFTGVSETELVQGRACGVFGCINAYEHPDGCGFGVSCRDCRLRLAIEDTLVTGQGHRDVEYRATLERAGVRRDVVLLGATARIESGESPRVLLCLEDITARVRAEEALARERNLLRTLIDHLPDSVWVKDTESRFVLGNQEVTRHLGAATPEDIIGKRDFAFHPQDRAEQYYADEQQVVRSGQPLLNREEIVEDQTTGKRLWNLATKVPLRDSEGKIVGLVGIGRDITARKRAEEALRESEEQARRLLDQQIAINQLALALGEHQSLNEVYRTIHQHIQTLVDTWFFVVSSYDAATQTIRAEYAFADRELDVSAFPPIALGEPGQGTQSRVIHTGEPLYTPDHQRAVQNSKTRYTIEDDGSIHEELPSEKDAPETTRSAVYVPMKVSGKTVGILQVQSRRLDAYRPADIQLLAGLANVAAVAVQNAKLHAEVVRELTERQRAEEQSRKSEERFRVAQEVSPDGFTILHPARDINGEIVDFIWVYENQTIAHINGTDPQKVIGKRLLDTFPTHRGTPVFEAYRNVANTGETSIFEEVYVGEMLSKPTWLRLVVVSMGEDIAILAQNITDRKQMELERQKFFLIAESSSEFIGMCDLDMQPLYVNPAGQRMVGLPDMAAACRVKVQDYFFPEDQTFITDEFFPRVLREGHGDMEIRLRHFQTGEPIWMSYYLFHVRDANGNLIGWATVSRDITERRQAEESLRASESLLKRTGSLARVGGWDLDAETLTVTWTEETYHIHEVPVGQVPSLEGAMSFFHPDDRKNLSDAIQHALDTGEGYDMELRFTSATGKHLWVRTVCQPEVIRGKTIRLIGTFQDITARKHAEREILQRNRELAALNQIGQSLNQLAAPEQIYETIANSIGQVLDNRNLYIAQSDEASQQISFPVYTIRGERRQIAGRAIGNGLTEYVIRTRAPLFVRRDLAGVMAERGIDLIGTPAHSFLAVPMRAGDKIIGVIALQDYERDDAFNEHHLELLTTIAAQAAGALENARLFAQVTDSARRQKALYEITAALARVHDTRELCAMIVSALRENLEYPFAGIFLIEPETGDRVLQAQSGWVDAPENWRHSPGKGLCESAILTGELHYTPDVTRDPKYVAGRSDTRSEVDVPIKIGDTILGVLVAEDPRANAFDAADFATLQAVANQLAVALERARLFEGQQALLAMTTRLYELSARILAALTVEETAQFVTETVRAGFAADACTITLFSETGHNAANFRLSVGFPPDFHQKAKGRPHGLTARVRASKDPIVATAEELNPYVRAEGIQTNIALPLPGEKENIGALFVGYRQVRQFSARERNLLTLFANQAALALRRARLLHQVQQRLAELQAINQISAALRAARTLDEMLPILLDRTLAALHIEYGIISLYDPASGMLHRAAVRGLPDDAPPVPMHPGEGIVGYVYTVGQAYIAHDISTDPLTRAASRQRIPPGWGGACVPLRTEIEVIGTLFVLVPLPRVISADEVHLLTTLAEIAGNAIQRARLHDQTERRLQRLVALRMIDQTINASFDLRVTLDVILSQVVAQLGVDAAAIMSLNSDSQMLEHLASLGFRSFSVDKMMTRAGEGLEGKIILERQTWLTSHLPDEGATFARAAALQADKFVTYCGTPLVAKGKVKGILEIFQRAALTPPAEWIEFLETLAGQIAITLDNAEMFETRQHALGELGMAYETTIEGWSRALDLRDRETEGHSQRVAELTVRLARHLQVPEDRIIHLRRGALLHDIGKMVIPDQILLKAGPLTDGEWEIMRQHPVRARDLLAPIAYLRPALEIPYSHHEKWDGSGYPDGLRGEQIPLAARIFAVADVWDAVLSDRPYRPAWTEARAREYLRAQSGTHFDPRVVDMFWEMLERG